ncbi:alpha/beta-hydrolase [Mollisia scopiformis]|uniref:Alpha/beta-hydrolase n=1 Tax=Mollisia scopiformis TaxID=149040 RepID=A0A194XU50_MOLSC|nr:alpha/beta-hydrolase [Mollisia scopiformis]KUJ23564.1 alpha/beta-hydrolase [Mollisia scopiformis]
MDPNMFPKLPPPLDPAWLVHEQAANLFAPQPTITDPKERRALYSQRCKDLNAQLLTGRDKHLAEGIKIHDTSIGTIPVRSYSAIPAIEGSPPPYDLKSFVPREPLHPIVVYYHGGGLHVGDLDSEDLTCRRICKELQCTVYSVEYRLMPEFPADDALADALRAFQGIVSLRSRSRLIIMGSSSGGQLAAQISQQYRAFAVPQGDKRIHGVLLRGPVTCDATNGGANLSEKLRARHTSMHEAFHTSLLANSALHSKNRTSSPLPLEVEDLSKLPRHWIQVSTNDIYYSDGVCYAEALREAGIDVKLDVVEGWPHTFWLKAPLLERAVQAENDMIEGLKWLIESEVPPAKKPRSNWGPEIPGDFVPFTDEEFEKKFMNV